LCVNFFSWELDVPDDRPSNKTVLYWELKRGDKLTLLLFWKYQDCLLGAGGTGGESTSDTIEIYHTPLHIPYVGISLGQLHWCLWVWCLRTKDKLEIMKTWIQVCLRPFCFAYTNNDFIYLVYRIQCATNARKGWKMLEKFLET
jgi:hypothetical protein